MYLFKERVANPHPLNKFPQNKKKFKKNFGKFLIFGGGGGGREGVGVILFIPRTVSKHKIQLLPSKVCAILYLFKERVANPHPLNKFPQNKKKFKKNFGKFLIFGGGGGGGEGVGVILFIPRTVLKHKIQLLPCKVCAISYLSKETVANPHPRM